MPSREAVFLAPLQHSSCWGSKEPSGLGWSPTFVPTTRTVTCREHPPAVCRVQGPGRSVRRPRSFPLAPDFLFYRRGNRGSESRSEACLNCFYEDILCAPCYCHPHVRGKKLTPRGCQREGAPCPGGLPSPEL